MTESKLIRKEVRYFVDGVECYPSTLYSTVDESEFRGGCGSKNIINAIKSMTAEERLSIRKQLEDGGVLEDILIHIERGD